MMFVSKRNGDVVAFDESRISNAILKAVKAINATIDQTLLDRVTHAICEEIRLRFKELHPNVENIQDIVEKHLVKFELYEIAKEYILYREKRRVEREKDQALIVEKSLLGKLTVKKRDGRVVLFDIRKLKETLVRASSGLEKDVSYDLITK
jgi:anaerobic ribonucleoside-triphosphate reductase